MASLAKPREQITGIVSGQIVPATDTPLLTSASTPWFGFLLEKHNAGDRQDILWGWHRAHVSLITKGQLSFSVRHFSGTQDYVGRAGSVCIFPSGFDETLFSISELKFEAIVIELDPALLGDIAGRAHGGFDQHSHPADRHTRSLHGASAESNGCGGRPRLSCRGALRPCVVPGIGHLSRPNVFGEEAH